MKPYKYFFGKKNILPVDKFIENVLFDKKFGYYSSKLPFGEKGDFLTSPKISHLFSEIIGIWIISFWISFSKPKKLNLVELGPGDGSLTKVLIETFKNFPEFNKVVKIYLYEKSLFLKNIQKKKINNKNIKWINSFDKLKNGPVIFFGNEFFDSIPIKQFACKNNVFYEKHYLLNKKNKVDEIYKKALKKDIEFMKKFKTFKNLNFIELPKQGFKELDKILKTISKLKGGLLLIDYGYLTPKNRNTLQSVVKHKKNRLLKNLGNADITSLVNFNLLKEYFIKKDFKVKKIVSQKYFLEKMGIMERANIISKKMIFREQANLYIRLKRILDNRYMGNLFKVIFTFKHKKNNFLGFK